MRKVPFVTGNYYHVFNRGVDKRQIFNDQTDHYRFTAGLIAFNNKLPIIHLTSKLPEIIEITKNVPKIVEVVCYCLMPNHYHLLLKQVEDNGISYFLQRLGIGYTNYFNKRNERSGVLFQGKSKNVLIENDEQLLHLSRYIHLNPNELLKGSETIESYKWSSYRNYLSPGPSYIVSGQEIIIDQVGGVGGYKDFVSSFKKEKDLGYIAEVMLEKI